MGLSEELSNVLRELRKLQSLGTEWYHSCKSNELL